MQVSVIIPVYNEEGYIAKCLQSLEAQVEKADEIIVVDNNCHDKTIEIAKKFDVRIIKEEKQGMIYARNAGFDSAKYEILARTDADAIVPPDWIAKSKKAFEDPALDALSGPAIFFEKLIVVPVSKILVSLYFHVLGSILGHPPIFGPNTVLRKSAWEKVKNNVCLLEKDVHEDIDLSIHLAKIGKIKFDNNFTVRSTRGRWSQVFTEYIVRLIKMLYYHRGNRASKK